MRYRLIQGNHVERLEDSSEASAVAEAWTMVERHPDKQAVAVIEVDQLVRNIATVGTTPRRKR